MTPTPNAAAQAWTKANPAGAVQAICTADSLRALRLQYVAMRRAWPATSGNGRTREAVRSAVVAIRMAVRALGAGARLAAQGAFKLSIRAGDGPALDLAAEPIYIVERRGMGPGIYASVHADGLPAMLADVPVNVEGLSALAFLHARQPVPVNPETRRDRRILPVIRPVEREAVLPALAGRYELDPGAPTLPLFPSRPVAHRVPLLDLADAAGVPIMARGRGAPLPSRLHVGLLLAVRWEDRGREHVRLTMPLGDLIAALYPNGWRSQLWPKLQAAMEDAARFGFHDGRGRWRAVALRYAPDHPDLAAPVVFDIAFPPGATTGPAVDLAALNRLSVESSPRWRAAIAAHSILWQPGVTRLPIPGRRGRPSGRWGWARDPNAYPVVTLKDRRRLAFGSRDSKNRTRREVDGAWFDLPGLTVAERSAVDPHTGAFGWRLLPAPHDDGEG